MARRKYRSNNPGTEDNTIIVESYTHSLGEYMDSLGPVSIKDSVDELGGRGELARAILGIHGTPAKGTQEARELSNLTRNIGRWIATEEGSGKQNRRPNKASMGKLRDLQLQMNPPQEMNIIIHGYIGYDGGDFRDRTIDIDTAEYPVDIEKFVEYMKAGDTHNAYREVFKPYASNLIVAEAYDIDIQFD